VCCNDSRNASLSFPFHRTGLNICPGEGFWRAIRGNQASGRGSIYELTRQGWTGSYVLFQEHMLGFNLPLAQSNAQRRCTTAGEGHF
jgi:hypothetical protein